MALGAARVGYAGLTIVMICAGLLTGLACGGMGLPPAGASATVAIGYDVIAAGVAVAAYGTFFSMPWRMLPIPVAIGMAAHALRWVAIAMAGASVETAAFVACCFVGLVATPIADRLRVPFAAFAFASVVSLIPGVFLFRMAAGLVRLHLRRQQRSIQSVVRRRSGRHDGRLHPAGDGLRAHRSEDADRIPVAGPHAA